MSIYSTPHNVACGDVVAYANAEYVTYRVSDDSVLMFALLHNLTTRHRADVSSTSWVDFAECSAPGHDRVVRCYPFVRAPKTGLVKLGAVSRDLLGRIERMTVRDAMARRFEDSASLASNLTAATHSRGRRLQPTRCV